jgi:hypothetical protein
MTAQAEQDQPEVIPGGSHGRSGDTCCAQALGRGAQAAVDAEVSAVVEASACRRVECLNSLFAAPGAVVNQTEKLQRYEIIGDCLQDAAGNPFGLQEIPRLIEGAEKVQQGVDHRQAPGEAKDRRRAAAAWLEVKSIGAGKPIAGCCTARRANRRMRRATIGNGPASLSGTVRAIERCVASQAGRAERVVRVKRFAVALAVLPDMIIPPYINELPGFCYAGHKVASGKSPVMGGKFSRP